ncbi:hypothetical protein QM012_001274 [Aureobasidium pullulans]|uniref:Uncharacterized protein n=1 Tax=Aureobasidium pullulans TaxID=5580 RepID=A0ABR0TDL0_AURPU
MAHPVDRVNMVEPYLGPPLPPPAAIQYTSITEMLPSQILPHPSPQVNLTYANLTADSTVASQSDIIQPPPSKRARLDEDEADAVIHDESTNPPLHNNPGNPKRPETFFDSQAERRLAGYLGFISISELHICAISWPLLRATVAIYPVIHKLNKELALTLIRDAERLGAAAVIDKDWSLLTSDGKGLSNARKAEHLAIVLINLRSDLATMTAASDKQNQLQHQHDCQKFNMTYPTHQCPQISYPVRAPILSPLQGEDFLESYNRCFLLLRHMRNIMKSNVFDTRYKNDNFKSGQPVNDEHKPPWMRSAVPPMTTTTSKPANQIIVAHGLGPSSPKQSPLQLSYSTIHNIETIPCQALVPNPTLPNDSASSDKPAANNAAAPRSFAVIWDHDLESECIKSGLRRALNRAQARGVDPPSELQKLRKDPRQMVEEPLLYEQIRIQFRCQFLGIDLSKLLLQYTTSAFGDSMTVKQNLQDEPWSDTQSALADPANGNFVFRVGFFAVED